ncbi:MAG: O-antigen ligase family protein [Planctomycetes bacterium]|nr:O-antigen ligase family protein [Planctomycetota bacterium]
MQDVELAGPEPARGPDRIAQAVEIVVFMLLVFAPFAFGAVEAWAQLVVVGLVSIAVLLWGIQPRAAGPSPAIRSPVTWLFAAFVILVGIQLIPLPSGIVGFLSPRTLSLKRELLEGLPGAAEGPLAISFYPFATKSDLRMVLAAGLVFFLVLDTVRSFAQVKRFLWVIVCIGIGMGILALFEWLVPTGKLYGVRELTQGGAPAGAFVNRNNFAGFVNLCVGAGAALAILTVDRVSKGGIGGLGGRDTGLLWLLWLGTAVMASMVFLCLSRGGMLSFFGAAIITYVIASWKRGVRGKSWLFTAGVAAGLGLVIWLGFDVVYDRLLTVFDMIEDSERMDVRVSLWRDLSAVVSQFPLLGTGLGTHRIVYPMFKTLPWGSTYTHAENEYMQLIEETGILGIAIVLAMIAFVAAGLARGLLRGRSRAVTAVQVGLCFSFLAQLFHAFTDFGLHMPANACLFAVLCALILALQRLGREAEGHEDDPDAIALPSRGVVRWRPIALLLILPALVWMGFSGSRAAVAEHYFNEQKAVQEIVEESPQPSDEDWDRMTDLAIRAARAEPEHADYRYRAADVGWESLRRAFEDRDAAMREAENRIPPIIDELNEIRKLAPTYGKALVLLGQIELVLYNNSLEGEKGAAGADLEAKARAERYIALGCRLDPTSPFSWYAAGNIAIRDGRFDEAAEAFRRSLSLSREFLPVIVDIYLNEFGRPDDLVRVCPDDLGTAGQLAARLRALKAPEETIAKLEERRCELLRKALEADPDSLDALRANAEHLSATGEYEEAIPLYRRAIRRAYGDPTLHLGLALALEEVGRLEEALREARLILSMRADDPQAVALRERVAEKIARGSEPAPVTPR